ncbi:MAG: hypothetical protein RJA70_711 [Pseudomonadota bacterium]|jgi:hypothetical protein
MREVSGLPRCVVREPDIRHDSLDFYQLFGTSSTRCRY